MINKKQFIISLAFLGMTATITPNARATASKAILLSKYAARTWGKAGTETACETKTFVIERAAAAQPRIDAAKVTLAALANHISTKTTSVKDVILAKAPEIVKSAVERTVLKITPHTEYAAGSIAAAYAGYQTYKNNYNAHKTTIKDTDIK